MLKGTEACHLPVATLEALKCKGLQASRATIGGFLSIRLGSESFLAANEHRTDTVPLLQDSRSELLTFSESNRLESSQYIQLLWPISTNSSTIGAFEGPNCKRWKFFRREGEQDEILDRSPGFGLGFGGSRSDSANAFSAGAYKTPVDADNRRV